MLVITISPSSFSRQYSRTVQEGVQCFYEMNLLQLKLNIDFSAWKLILIQVTV